LIELTILDVWPNYGEMSGCTEIDMPLFGEDDSLTLAIDLSYEFQCSCVYASGAVGNQVSTCSTLQEAPYIEHILHRYVKCRGMFEVGSTC